MLIDKTGNFGRPQDALTRQMFRRQQIGQRRP
jgi:hypothetical protein